LVIRIFIDRIILKLSQEKSFHLERNHGFCMQH
jgi:hypothetical protein